MFSCSQKNPGTAVSPDANAKDSIKKKNVLDNDFSEDLNIELNMPEIIEDLRMDIKNLKAELDYQHESLSKLEAQTQVWAIHLRFIIKKSF